MTTKYLKEESFLKEIMTKLTNRVEWIDIARAICIFCVILTHTKTCPDYFRWFFSPYFMPAFFFLSGVVYRSAAKVKISVINSAIKLLVPYFSFFIIGTFVRLNWIEAIQAGNYAELYQIFETRIYSMVLGKGIWFLPCLFLVQIISSIIIRIFANKRHLLIIAFISFGYAFILNNQEIVPWSANTALFALGYFLLGYVIQNKIRGFELSGKGRFYGFCFALSYFLLLYIVNILHAEPFDFDMHCNKFSSNPLWYIGLSLMGITAVCVLSAAIKRNSFLSFVGSSSLVIYLYHGYSGLFARELLSLIRIMPESLLPQYYTLIFAAFSLLIALLISLFINRYFPILIGRGPTMNRIVSKYR